MNGKRILALALAALLWAGAAGAEIVVHDMLGRDIHLDGPAARVVALSAADCEILYAIGAGDALVGRGEYCNYPPEVTGVPSVQSGYETNVEQILALMPDAVVMSSMAQTKATVEAIERAGVKVIESEAYDVSGVYESIRMLGTLMGRGEEAERVVGEMQGALAAVSEGKIGAGKTIYFEVSPLEYGLWTAGSGTFMNEIAQMLGLVNCFGDVEGWAQISEEQVLARNPDYILTITPDYGGEVSPTDEILARAGWQDVAAVKNLAILNLQNDELSRPSPSLAQGARMLYNFLLEKGE